jgi:hypothetical protein
MCKAGHWPILFENCLEFFLRTKPQNQLLPGGFFLTGKILPPLYFQKVARELERLAQSFSIFFHQISSLNTIYEITLTLIEK